MMDIFQGSVLNEIVNGMIAHLKTQIENPALVNNRFIFNEVLFLDVNFHRLNLTGGSSYLPIPDWVSRKGGVIILRMKKTRNVSSGLLLQFYIM